MGIGGSVVKANGTGGTYEKVFKHIGDTFNKVDGLLVNSWLELKAVQTDLNWKGNNYGVGYYGVDAGMFMKNEPENLEI